MSTIFREIPYNEIMQTFQSRLRELRKANGLSQKQLAEIIGSNNSSICDWECGRTQPDLEALVKLAHYFCVTTDDLLGIDD